MSSTRFDPNSRSATQVPTQGGVQVASARPRQTEAPASPFRSVLAGGAGALLTGAEVAASVMGGSVLAAAVHQTKADVMSKIAGEGAGGAAASTAGPNAELEYLDKMHAMQKESQFFNMKLFELQEQVQGDNRQFTTLSNVSRAKHDTASACVKNIH